MLRRYTTGCCIFVSMPFIGQVVTKYRDLVTLDFHCLCVSIKSFVPAILGLLPVFSVFLLEPSVLGADTTTSRVFNVESVDGCYRLYEIMGASEC